jgi:Family of unknown function (DUF5670)
LPDVVPPFRIKVGLTFVLLLSLPTEALPQMSNALRTISMALLLLWFLGMVTGHTLGGFIHAFLVFGVLSGLICYVRDSGLA